MIFNEIIGCGFIEAQSSKTEKSYMQYFIIIPSNKLSLLTIATLFDAFIFILNKYRSYIKKQPTSNVYFRSKLHKTSNAINYRSLSFQTTNYRVMIFTACLNEKSHVVKLEVHCHF